MHRGPARTERRPAESIAGRAVARTMPGAAIAAGQAIARLGHGGGGGRVHLNLPTSELSFTPSAAFDCSWQCTECGFQISPPPSEASEDSYRSPADPGPRDRRPEGPCAGCGARGAWANLREGAVVEALIVQDETRQSTRGARRSGLITLLGLAAWTAVVGWAVYGHGGWFFFPLALATALVMGRTAYAEYRSGRRARYAVSWTHELPPRGRARATRTGALAGEGALRAPLSGRLCLAYELGVRHDGDAEADPWTWTLLEQRSLASLRVGGAELSSSPHLRLRRELYVDALSPAARDELRKRGLDPSRPGYTLFETIVERGEIATVSEHRRGVSLSL